MKESRQAASPCICFRPSLPVFRILLTILVACAALQVHAQGYAFFPPQAIAALKTNSEKNSEARSYFTTVFRFAGQSLGRQPSAQETLKIEGHLASQDGVTLNDDMHALIALGLHYRLNGNAAALAKASQYLLAWASAYKPTGNPIDEEIFYKFVAGYELVREDIAPGTRQVVGSFLRLLFEKERAFTAAREIAVSHSNWESRHLALATAIAYTLGDPVMIDYCVRRYREQISYNILPGGTLQQLYPAETPRYPQLAGRKDEYVPRGATFDFLHRDAMEYHVASLHGLLSAAWVARNQGLDWLGTAGSKGQTLRDGLDFTVPYATGAKSHAEFARTIVTFDIDKKRAGPFNPRYAQVLLSLAAALDSRYAAHANSAVLPQFEKLLYFSRPS